MQAHLFSRTSNWGGGGDSRRFAPECAAAQGGRAAAVAQDGAEADAALARDLRGAGREGFVTHGSRRVPKEVGAAATHASYRRPRTIPPQTARVNALPAHRRASSIAFWLCSSHSCSLSTSACRVSTSLAFSSSKLSSLRSASCFQIQTKG